MTNELQQPLPVEATPPSPWRRALLAGLGAGGVLAVIALAVMVGPAWADPMHQVLQVLSSLLGGLLGGVVAVRVGCHQTLGPSPQALGRVILAMVFGALIGALVGIPLAAGEYRVLYQCLTTTRTCLAYGPATWWFLIATGSMFGAVVAGMVLSRGRGR